MFSYKSLFLCNQSVLFNSFWPCGLQHSRFPYISLSPAVCSNSCPLYQWCHPTISPSVASFSSCLLSFPETGSFPMSWLFVLCGQSIGTSASASVLPRNTQGWFPLGLTGLISLLSKAFSRVFSNTIAQEHQFFPACPFMVQLSHPYITTGKTMALTIWTFVHKTMSLFLKMMSSFLLAFLLRSNRLLISWLQSLSTMIWSPRK